MVQRAEMAIYVPTVRVAIQVTVAIQRSTEVLLVVGFGVERHPAIFVAALRPVNVFSGRS